MDTKQDGGDVKRRRRRSGERSGRGLTTASSYLQHPAVSRVAPMVMAGAAALYVVASFGWIVHSAQMFGPLTRGISKIDTRYISGPPTRDEGEKWIYEQGASTTTLIYDGSDRAVQLHCVAHSAAAGACVSFMGLGVNTSEDQIWRALGVPDQQTYHGEIKVIAYSGLGVQFTLERFQVKGIALIPQNNPGLMLSQMSRMILP